MAKAPRIRHDIADFVPPLLYRGNDFAASHHIETKQQPLPIYKPDRDRLSVVFAAIHRDDTTADARCKSRGHQFSALKEHFFHWQTVSHGLEEVAFKRQLKNWLAFDCRSKGSHYATALAEWMILPYVHDKMAGEGVESSLYANTYVIILDNEITYGAVAPDRELAKLGTLEGNIDIQDKDTAEKLINRVESAFYLYSRPEQDWMFAVDGENRGAGSLIHGLKTKDPNRLRIRYLEVRLKEKAVQNLLDYHKKLPLDRRAISSSKLKLDPEILLRILPSQYVEAQQLRIYFEDEQGGPWKIGRLELAGSKNAPGEYSITECIDRKICTKNEQGIQIRLLSLAAGNALLDKDDAQLGPGKIQFLVRFLYNASGTDDEENAAPLYPHQIIDSPWQSMDIEPVAAAVIPGSDHVVVFPAVVLDNSTLTELYDETKDKNSGLTQEEAKHRIHVHREKELAVHELTALIKKIWIVIATALAVAALFLFLFLKFYHRRFIPELKWTPANKIALDFNQQPGAKVHVGVLSVINTAAVPWLGRLLRNDKHPDVSVTFSLPENPLLGSKFVLNEGGNRAFNPIGFMDVNEGEELVMEKDQVVSHHSTIDLFLATDAVTDYRANPPPDDKTMTVRIDSRINMGWPGGETSCPCLFEIEPIPERAKYPIITFTPVAGSAVFKINTAPEVGVYTFASQARHRFSRLFNGGYDIYGLTEANQPVLENTMYLNGSQQVSVPALGKESRSVRIKCDGVHVKNPKPHGAQYRFELKGPSTDGSERGPHCFTLQRDPTPADVRFEVSLGHQKAYRIYWEKVKGEYRPLSREGGSGRFESEGRLLENNRLALSPRLVKFKAGPKRVELLKLIIGNTGQVGDGMVEATLTMDWSCSDHADQCLQFERGYSSMEDLLWVSTSEQELFLYKNERLRIAEGKPDKDLRIELNAGRVIKKIEGGRAGTLTESEIIKKELRPDSPAGELVNGKIILITRLSITLSDGQNSTPRHYKLEILYPIGLEKRPHANWLCIDFGTSAIVAAVGRGRDAELLPLQRIKDEKNQWLNYGEMDRGNFEQGSVFLPSFVACDADLRQAKAFDDQVRKGSPIYQPASREPGKPDFISLPATTQRIEQFPGRVIYSLKSWLSQPTNEISLGDSLKYYDSQSGVEVERDYLPLDKVLESGFAALANAYIVLREEFEQGGQLVLSYPNTFTVFHQQKLKEIAYRALSPYQAGQDDQRLGIDLRERIQLISESDAVGFYHCLQRRDEGLVKKQRERMLVYDFGAGTLDLSLIHIEWDDTRKYPRVWTVENRLGVPIAGNHFDTVLARLIDSLLKDKSILNPLPRADGGTDPMFEYQFPVVGRPRSDRRSSHRDASMAFWKAILQAKHGDKQDRGNPIPAWDGESMFRVALERMSGDQRSHAVVYQGKDLTEDISRLAAHNRTLADSQPFIEVLDADDMLYLNIPAERVRNFPRMEETIRFVTQSVIDELLDAVEIGEAGKPISLDAKKARVDILAISGRGALWPGLADQVSGQFPNLSNQPRVEASDSAKSAVVRGAIARQVFGSKVKKKGPLVKPRLAIKLEIENSPSLKMEEAWCDKTGDPEPIDLTAAESFRLVQITIKNPNEKDFQHSNLRRHFYTQLAPFYKDDYWERDSQLYIVKKGHGETMTVRVENRYGDGEEMQPLRSGDRGAIALPWPIGAITLDAE